MIVGRKVRIYPNKEQEKKLFQSVGVARWAYNWTLSKQEENYKLGNSFITEGVLRKEITKLKKKDEYKWLNDVSAQISKQAVKDACKAYKKFFDKKADKPRFKSRKKSKPSFYNRDDKLNIKGGFVTVERFGRVRLAENVVSDKYYNPRVSYDGLSWWLSVSVDIEPKENSNPKSEAIGIDLGIKELAVCSNGKRYKNINKTIKMKKLKKRLKRQQRKASKQYEKLRRKERVTKSNNLLKLERQIRKTYKRMNDLRNNHIHQMTSELVKAKPEYVVIETLNIRGMMKNKHIAESIQEQKLYEVVRQLRYKCDWNDIPLIEADRFYPSSKTCSCCGYVKKDLKLGDREFICPQCNERIDRDYNASINLREYERGKLVA